MQPRAALWRKQLGEHCQDFLGGRVVDPRQAADHSGPVHGPDLIEHNLPGSAFEPDGDSARLGTPLGGHRSDDDVVDVAFISSGEMMKRGRLSNLRPRGEVQPHEVSRGLEDYHLHSVLSQRVSRRGSDPAGRRRAVERCGGKPRPSLSRGLTADQTTRWSACASSSGVSPRRHCSSRVFEIPIPRE
jgi:hypothetical protein